MGIEIRKMNPEDYSFVLGINQENVSVLSPMDMERLEFFLTVGELALVSEIDGEMAGFLIALREGIDEYNSENYRWFSERYDTFLYVDRIVIGGRFRRRGIGEAFYEYIFSHAAKTGVGLVTCEVDTIPYNEVSLGFHKKMGFIEVGSQSIRNNEVKVSLQTREVKRNEK